MSTAKLYLLPSSLGESSRDRTVPPINKAIISEIKFFACENLKSARRFLISCGLPSPIPEDITFIEIRNDEDKDALQEAIGVLKNGHELIYLSEAGNPCIADPGEALVDAAHRLKVQVIPLVGPSSILLALIASGLNGEQFTFHGYVPRDKSERIQAIKKYSQQAAKGYTQIFMDTPYRNTQLLEAILTHSSAQKISIAIDLCCDTEEIISGTISDIRKMKHINLQKRPCMFLLGN